MADMADVLSDYSGLSWSELATKLDLKSIDCDGVFTTAVEGNKAETDTMKLKKEEMTLYGLCPAQDEFFLVICEYCHLLIKPQALQYHMDVRHQNYSNSHVHNCAVPLCAIDPAAARITKCSSHKTNSSISLQSTSSQPQKPCTSKPAKGRPAKAKVLPISKGVAKNCTENPKSNSLVSLNSTFSELNIVLQRSSTDVKRHSVSAVGALEPRVSNSILDNNIEKTLSTSVQGNSLSAADDIKVELKDFDDSVVLEPSNLKISEEKEALVKLLESNEWCNFDTKIEEKFMDVSHPLSQPDESECQIVRTCDIGTYANNVNSSLVTVVRTLTLTTTTCSMSKSTSTLLLSPGVRSVAKSSSGFRTPNISAETPLAFDTNRNNLTESKGAGAASGSTQLPEAFPLKTVGVSSKDRGGVKSDTKPQPQTPVLTDKEAGRLKSSSESICHSISNVISQVPLKSIKGRKMSSKLILCKDREFDPNKHCGVWIEDIQKQCTRSLTCKSHSLSLRRAVSGRSKAFDQLLNEQRERKTVNKDKITKCITNLKDRPTATVSNDCETSLSNGNSGPRILNASTSSSCNSAFGNVISASSEHRLSQAPALAQHCDMIKRPTTSSNLTWPVKSFYAPGEESVIAGTSATEKATEDGGKDEAVVTERTSIDSNGQCVMSHHPHPAAVNGFNSWLYGRGCYVFNRREDLVRAAFLSAVEKHLNPTSNKNLCLESKLTTDVSGSNRDPYDFILPDCTKSRIQLPPSLPSQVTRPKIKQVNPSEPADRRSSCTSPFVPNNGKRPANDLLENKRKILKADQTSDEMLSSSVSLIPTIMSTKSADAVVHLSNLSSSAGEIKNSSAHLPSKLETSSILNGHVVGISTGELLLSPPPHQGRTLELSLPQLNKVAPKTVQSTSKAVLAASKTLPLSAKVVPGYSFSQNAGLRLELRPAVDVNKVAVAESSAVSLISHPTHHVLSQDCIAAKTLSCASSTAGNSLLRPTASLITANKIPNIVLTPQMPNGTLKVTPRNATPRNITNSSSLAAILGLKQEAPSKLTLTESQAFISANLSSLGKATRVPASPSSETSKQLNHNLPANVSATIQVHATLTTPMSQTSMRTGFSTVSTGVPMGSRQYILASDMRQIYSTPLSNTPKKPIAAGRVQVLRPDTTPSSKTAPSTAALVAGNKCQLSGQPI